MSPVGRGADGANRPLDPEALRERVSALKHDLGKYVAWTSANLPDEAWEAGEEIVDALVGDLLRTRTREDGVEAAWEVWERLTADLPRPLREPELRAVEEAVSLLRTLEPALRGRDGATLRARAADIRAAQGTIRSQLRALHARLARP